MRHQVTALFIVTWWSIPFVYYLKEENENDINNVLTSVSFTFVWFTLLFMSLLSIAILFDLNSIS